MKYAVLFLAAAATGTLASLNCTTTAEINTYCCPDTTSELVKTSPAGALIMLGCAADDTQLNWYWNYNGLYTPFSTDVVDCNLNGMAFQDMKGKGLRFIAPHRTCSTIWGLSFLPECKVDTFVLDLTQGKSGPLDACNPNCMSEDSFPSDTYFGDRQKETNMAVDFPAPQPPTWPPGGVGRRRSN
ncbi:hypothetical protein AJ80_07400 [Polytolypa hystricis UAMH7299]|uniref:Cyanovirin-N domain-containing protein n=1 Tax=Polytolypa hystricis (strain UAMH7299) TaxID=1447883 RepID=A0A2B7XP91_POLH7|nr:hypothetical protein AJ80_07400 [Polytolypa hystricis UAMH7299]